uniref:ATP synthase complex subunit 8 n=1 Tax=Trichoferus campestris TaxID=351093 RepID=A0A343ERG4_9CUCU|nr:ATP synthase F0 subunit 8 [Trichoferus campestris]QWB85732.1 ATP synthase F0 subunit 8 [Trichoferus campestris]
MPQMAPLNWLTLFIYFSVIFISFNLMNYYSFIYKIKSIKKTPKKLLFSWKW